LPLLPRVPTRPFSHLHFPSTSLFCLHRRQLGSVGPRIAMFPNVTRKRFSQLEQTNKQATIDACKQLV
jgi:hypothetical protein